MRDFEPTPFAKQHVGGRDTDVLQFDFHMPMRRIVITEHWQMSQDVHARRVEFHQHHRLLRMALGFEVGLAHDDGDLAARVARARRPPFDAVQYIFVALASDRGFDIGRIGRCHRRLGHQEGRTDFAVHQRDHPALLLLSGAVAQKHFHIAGVGRGAVEHFGGKADAAHFLGAQSIFHIGEAGAFECHAFVNMRTA